LAARLAAGHAAAPVAPLPAVAADRSSAIDSQRDRPRLPLIGLGSRARPGNMEGMAEQSYREREPSPAVARHVASVFVQTVAPGGRAYRHRTIPHGAVEILCPVGGLPQIVGPQTGARVDVLAPGATVVGARFRLGAAPAALGLPASELVDLTIGADALWGAAAVELGEQVAAAATTADAAALLEQAVFAREVAETDPVVVEVADRLLPGHAADVAALPSQLFISERQLRRRVQAGIGMAPKVVHRMLRFQGFLALAHGREGHPAELARLAAEAGYADQSHLTRECLRLSGLSPAALMRESLENCRAAGHDHAVSYAPLLDGLH
jgi:AraC-like DNA-binding protein